MVSREEYEQVIQVFLVELNHLCLGASETALRALPQFAKEIDSYLADMRDPTTNAAQVLYTAFAYLDEYVGADWQTISTAGYKAYVLGQQDTGAGPKKL